MLSRTNRFEKNASYATPRDKDGEREERQTPDQNEDVGERGRIRSHRNASVGVNATDGDRTRNGAAIHDATAPDAEAPEDTAVDLPVNDPTPVADAPDAPPPTRFADPNLSDDALIAGDPHANFAVVGSAQGIVVASIGNPVAVVTAGVAVISRKDDGDAPADPGNGGGCGDDDTHFAG